MEKKIDSFEVSKFINISTEEQSLLFSNNSISQSDREKFQQYISSSDWRQSAPTKYGMFLDHQETLIHQLFNKTANVYILMISSLLASTKFICKITSNQTKYAREMVRNIIMDDVWDWISMIIVMICLPEMQKTKWENNATVQHDEVISTIIFS